MVRRLLFALVIAVPMVFVGLASPVESASPYCNVWANAPYDTGSYNLAKGGFTCSSHAVPARYQVCIYQGSTQLFCDSGAIFANAHTENVTCSNVSTANAYFRTWSWVQDDDDNSEGVWSGQTYIDKCR